MKILDDVVLVVYILAMTILLALGICEYDLPIFVVGFFIAFLAAVGIIKSNIIPKKEDESK